MKSYEELISEDNVYIVKFFALIVNRKQLCIYPTIRNIKKQVIE